MRFSTWRAAGNEYLLAERAELGAPLTAEDVREVCQGADGVLEVVASDGDEAEIVIWNADGSQAEMSGNGTRIAARWLANRSGTTDVHIRVGELVVTSHLRADGSIEQEMGNVEVGRAEMVAGIELVPVSVGNPHAVVRGDPAEISRIGPLL